MFRSHRSVRHAFVSATFAGLCSTAIHARPNGFAVECGGCHYGQLEGGGVAEAPIVLAVSSASRVEPGEQVEITVTVESKWADALAAGFLVMTGEGGGVFTATDEGTGNVGVSDGAPFEYAIGHTAARTLTGGIATFQTTWTAPVTAGAYEFAVFGVTTDDADGMDDPEIAEESNEPFAKFEFAVGVGCDLVTYFSDGDGDGYGKDEVLSCDLPEGAAAEGGDCDDGNPAVNPGATELCSFTDENCDGDRMAPPTYFRDADGDGFGAIAEIVSEGCTPPEGYVEEAGDCDPEDAAINPTAAEVPGNGVDDNCNGMIDEAGAAPNPGVNPTPNPPATSEPSAPGSATTAPTSTAPGTTPEPSGTAPVTTPAASNSSSGGGCAVATRSEGGVNLGTLLVLLCAALFRRRLKVTVSA